MEFETIALQDLTANELHSLFPLILESAQREIKKYPDDAWFLVKEFEKKVLIGLSLFKYIPHNSTAQLYSLVISPSYRKQGYGFALFQKTEEIMKEKKARALGFDYIEDGSNSLAMDKILKKAGWSPAKPYLIRCLFDAQLFNPPWLYQNIPFPSQFHVFRWRDLPPEAEKLIEHGLTQGSIVHYFSPFRDDEEREDLNSLGLREGQEVIGWVITHRVNPDTIRYSMIYMKPEYQGSGYGLALLIEAIKRQKQSSVPLALFEINLKEIEPTWLLFHERHLIPLAKNSQTLKWAFKRLDL